MEKTENLNELIEGYLVYSETDELNVAAAADAPATSAPCAAATASWLISQFSGKTIAEGC
ncbi:hypothetical protein Aph02nite_59710 [Actinoplanes philippinensis]|jgi:hypothetical protein|uniref:Uncharacterized protein n=1 Tax=Actinoplanes philippinensis TaxID=35752 RepID=A0A1I2JJJ4_9ACTN|nr:LxmA leader domain family RiPP [Actinoplanes philippinensis]GIE80021.1 hypothetical protein Aph02nite_59710 [Actinoplanes philippinensis]SFF52861.1 hypothetical protein SAMN05421541_112181 [Actinoplanes philippinensis]